MAQLAPETQARMFRAVIAQVAEGRPPDAMAAMLSDPKLIDMPGVREQVVKLAKENQTAVARAAQQASADSDARLAAMKGTDDELANEKALATEDQAALKDYASRLGLEDDAEIAGILEAADAEISRSKAAGNAAKQAAACLIGAL